jgi:hypothetical protein
MINAEVFFLFYIIVWGFIGTSRGWVRDVIVTFSMIFAFFIYSVPQVTDLLKPLWEQEASIWRFFWRSLPFLIITGFGYLSPIVARGAFLKQRASSAGCFRSSWARSTATCYSARSPIGPSRQAC